MGKVTHVRRKQFLKHFIKFSPDPIVPQGHIIIIVVVPSGTIHNIVRLFWNVRLIV